MIYAQHFTSHFIAAKIAQLECRKYFQKNLQHPIVRLSYLLVKSQYFNFWCIIIDLYTQPFSEAHIDLFYHIQPDADKQL